MNTVPPLNTNYAVFCFVLGHMYALNQCVSTLPRTASEATNLPVRVDNTDIDILLNE